ncbi:MAG: M42 family metallopeptidase [Acutalibacteraceae bacterium]
MKELLKTLCMLDGISGRETAVRDYILSQLKSLPYMDRCIVDPLGNLLVHLKGVKEADKTLLYAAHMDEVGLMATGITEEGFVRLTTVGGIDQAVLFGHRIRFRDRVGVIGGKAIHMCKDKEKDEIPKEDLLADIGADNREEAAAAVCVGDAAVFDSDFHELGHLVKGRAIDDRAGCALLLTLAQTQPPYDMWLAFTVQEEVGLRGAKTAAYTVKPDIAVVVDATTAADTVGVKEDKRVCAVGGGAVVSFMDRRTLYDKELYELIMKTAQEQSIKVQPKSVVAGGNDAGSIQTAGSGARVAAVSLPCRYIHSPSCVLSMDDMEETKKLLSALCERLIL